MLCALVGCTAQNNNFQSVEVDEFDNIINSGDVLLVDVRTASEYASGHIDGALNIDVQQSDFKQKATMLPADKTIAVYCRSGRRSKKAASILADSNYKVVELNNGIKGWTAASKPVTTEVADVFTTKNGIKIKMYCIKHGSIRMQIGDKWIYVDPVTKAAQPVTDYTSMPKADAILITHEHGDHLDKEAISQLSTQETMLIVNPRSNEVLGGKGAAMKNGEEKTLFGTIKIEAVPAYNTSAEKQNFHPKGRDHGYIITVDGFRIYVAGDTEDIAELDKIKDIDVAFMPCNLPYTMTVEQLAKAAKTVSPKVLFPYHYGNTEIAKAAEQLKGTAIEVRIRQYQ